MKLGVFFIVLALTLAPGVLRASAQETTPGRSAFDEALELIESDPSAAMRLFEPLAQSGDAEAMNALAMMVEHDGPDWKADPARAAGLREKAIEAGSRAAGLNVAVRALHDASGDHKRAIELLRQAETEQALRPATAYAWARAYLFGYGVEQDLKVGTEYLLQAVKSDPANADVQFLLGRAYQNGWGIEPDKALAYRHLRIAAERGDERAQWRVGMMLLDGDGVTADAAEAYRFVKQSAESGYVDGMISHAVMLALGQGTAENDAEARRWYLQAAERGSPHAMRGLGVMHVIGEGGPPDAPLGFALLELAASAGEPLAPKLIQQLQAQAKPDQMAVDAAKADWLAAHDRPDAPN